MMFEMLERTSKKLEFSKQSVLTRSQKKYRRCEYLTRLAASVRERYPRMPIIFTCECEGEECIKPGDPIRARPDPGIPEVETFIYLQICYIAKSIWRRKILITKQATS